MIATRTFSEFRLTWSRKSSRRDFYPPVPGVDHEQHEVTYQPRDRQHLDRGEVRRAIARRCVRSKAFHGIRLPRRCRLDAMPPKDPIDRVAANSVAGVIQRADQPRVAPARNLRRHPYDELFHVGGDRGAPGPTAGEPSYLRAINSRYQRTIVSGVTRLATSPSRRRPTALPLTAKRRRWYSVNRRRRPPSCSRSTRFSSQRKVMTSSCREWSQPVSQRTRNRTASVSVAATG